MACEIKDPTNNPICSDSIKDLKDNAIIMDQYINSAEFEVPDRLGIPRKTWAGLEKDVQDALVNLDPKLEQLIAEKIIAQGAVELTNDYGLAEGKAISQKGFTEKSSRIPNSIGEKNFQEIKETSGNIAVVNGEVNEDRDLSNIYTNGSLKSLGFDYIPLLSDNMITNQARFNCFGGQLASLKSDLVNPLVQKIEIQLIGDSITWGSGTGQSAPFEPRTGNLSDPRDHFASNSWVNIFKRFIGKRYFDNVDPQLSNYHSSPSGQSIASYEKEITIFPYIKQGFSYKRGGEDFTPEIAQYNNSITKWRSKVNYFPALQDQQEISFNFTGNSFDVYFTKFRTCRELRITVGENIFYIDAYLEDGVLDKQKQTIEFDFVKDQVVTMSPINRTDGVTSDFWIEGIVINKKVEIHNNGIIGQSTSGFYNAGLLKEAVTFKSNYCIIMLGANDRVSQVNRGAMCVSQLNHYIGLMESYNKSVGVKTILMTTPNAESRDIDMFTAQEAGNALLSFASINGNDLIDNQSVLVGTNYDSYTSDKLHLNLYGNAVVARNIITALESSN